MRKQEAYSVCRRYVNQYVRVQTRNGRIYDGVIEKVDKDNVYLIVPMGGSRGDSRSHSSDERYPDSSYGGYYPYNPYSYPYPYAYPYSYPFPYSPYYIPRRRRRFRRVTLPLSLLTGVVLGGLLL